MKFSLLVFKIRGFEGGGIGDLCRRRGGGYYRAWRGLGAWHRNPRDDLRASFRNRGERTWCPRAHREAQWPNYHRLPWSM
jgi:hypothetical protein